MTSHGFVGDLLLRNGVVDAAGLTRAMETQAADKATLGRALANLGLAANGREALDLLHAMAKADVVLVDWNMPEMDGIAFVRAVRSNDEYAALPLMMVTTNVELSNVAEALDAGANEYIMKPFTMDILREKLELLGFQAA